MTANCSRYPTARRECSAGRLGGWVRPALMGLVSAWAAVSCTTVSRVTYRSYRWERSTLDCVMEVCAVADALRHYRAEHGALPGSLAELVPRYIDSVPRCPEDPVPGRPSYLYCPPGQRSDGVPLLSCERHWEAGLNIVVSPALRVAVLEKVPRWAPGHRFSSWDAQTATCQANLARIAQALRAFRHRRGRLPGALSELTPQYIDVIPQCPSDLSTGRCSYLYWPGAGDASVPLVVTCERHWVAGVDLSVTNSLEVRADAKPGLAEIQVLTHQDAKGVEDARDALIHGSLPYVLRSLGGTSRDGLGARSEGTPADPGRAPPR